MLIEIPEPSLVLLVGPSGVGKSTFARRHFRATEILASDALRALVADDENARDADQDAFVVLRLVAARRSRRGRLTVIDATNVEPRSRRPLLLLAQASGLPVVAIVFDLPAAVLGARNRSHRGLAPEVVERQAAGARLSLQRLREEGVSQVHRLDSEEAIGAAVVRRRPVVQPRPQPPQERRQSPLARQLELL